LLLGRFPTEAGSRFLERTLAAAQPKPRSDTFAPFVAQKLYN